MCRSVEWVRWGDASARCVSRLLLGCTLLVWIGDAWPFCGPLPADNPIYAGSSLDVAKDASVNGNPIAQGNTGAGSFLGGDGTRGTLATSLPDLAPASFPANPSSTDADQDDSPFVASSAVYYDDVEVAKNSSASFSGGGTFHIGKLTVEDGATISLAAGVYFVDELEMKKDASLAVTSNDVLLHIGSKMDVDKNVGLNVGGSVTALQVMLHSGAEFKAGKDLRLAGLLLGPQADKIDIDKDAVIHGAIISGAEVKLDKDAEIVFTAADQSAVAGVSTCDGDADHLAIAHDGSGVNCAVEPVTLSVHRADHSVVDSYAGTIALATGTGHGDWSLLDGDGVLVNDGAGLGSYTFDVADLGMVTLGLRDTFVETVGIDSSTAGLVEHPAEDAGIEFLETGFRFLADGVTNAIGTQIAAKPSAVAPAAQVIELQAIRTDDQSGACEAGLVGPVAILVALECRDSPSCGVTSASVNGVAVPTNDSGAVVAYAAVPLDFGDAGDGTATLTLSHADAGRVRWHARHELVDADAAATGNLMVGASNEHVVRPFGFVIDFAGDRASNGTAGVSYAADADGSRFVKAGASFTASLRAVVWTAADDSDADGLPDAGANLFDNPTTPSFLAETTPPPVLFSRLLVAPAGGSAGSLAGGLQLPYGSGSASAALVFDEVGIIDIVATASDYLGSGASVSGRAAKVGRFYPARLEWTDDAPALRNGPDATWSCGFTWMEQPFTFLADPVFTVIARNAAGAITANYAAEFFKLEPPYLSDRGYTSSATSAAALDAPALGNVTLAGAGDFDGSATLTLADEQLAYTRGVAPEAPFDASINMTLVATDLTDSDGVCHRSVGTVCNTGDGDTGDDLVIAGIDGASLRFGRLTMHNASGAELLPVALPTRTEFHDGAGFTIATDDGCTRLPAAALDLVNDGDDPATGVPVIAVAAGISTAGIGNDPLLAGEAALQFSAPLAGNIGYVEASFDLSLAAAAWLRFDWDGDGAHDDDPRARATFGILSGSAFLIDVREPWN